MRCAAFRIKKKYIIASLIFFVAIAAASILNKRIMPYLLSISQAEAKRITNNVIDKAVRESISDMELKTEDFVIDVGNKISANTILINKLCTEVSTNINEDKMIFEEREIKVAIGAITKWEFLSNIGPKVGFSIREVRQAEVDYETSFSSAGINQTNYKVWLNVELEVKLVNPLGSDIVSTKRKVMLVDTIIEGKVPDKFLLIE